MKKRSQKRHSAVLIVLFLIGALMFIWPMLSELVSYQEDNDEYGSMAERFHAPESSPTVVPPTMAPEVDVSLTAPPEARPLPTALPTTEAPDLPVVTETAPSATPEVNDDTPTPSPANQEAETIPKATATEDPPVEVSEGTAAPSTATPRPTPTAAPTKSPTISPAAGVDLEACLSQNRDFVAWITIPGTVIDYPVVRSDNTEHYLHHLFTGKQSKLGTLFSLKSSDYRTPSRNIAIYGHHLSHSDAMFSTLMNYKDPAWYEAHNLIHLDTLYGSRDYRIFAVINMKVSEWDAATASFASDDSFLRFVDRARRKALYETGVQVTASDCILTLITCDRVYGGVSGRLIVMAVQE